MNKRQIIIGCVIVVLFVVTHLPLIGMGFGSDSDAYRVANATKKTLDTGVYHYGREPGAPVFEVSQLLLLQAGNYYLTNSVTLLMSIGALIFFYLIVIHYKVPNPFLLVFALAFFPAFWSVSANSIDFNWALCLFLAAYYLVLKGRWLGGAALLALATGCRFNTCILAIPLIAHLYYANKTPTEDSPASLKINKPVMFTAFYVLFSVVCYFPILMTYGLSSFRPAYLPYTFIEKIPRFGFQLIMAFGMLGLLSVVIVIVIKGKKTIKALLPLSQESRMIIFILIFHTALIFWVPMKPCYFIPAIPFLLILLSRVLPKKMLIGVIILICSANLVDISAYNVMTRKTRFKIVKGSSFNVYENADRLFNTPRRVAAMDFSGPVAIVMVRLKLHNYGGLFFEIAAMERNGVRIKGLKKVNDARQIIYIDSDSFAGQKDAILGFAGDGVPVYCDEAFKPVLRGEFKKVIEIVKPQWFKIEP